MIILNGLIKIIAAIGVEIKITVIGEEAQATIIKMIINLRMKK